MTSTMITRGGEPIERAREISEEETHQRRCFFMHIYASAFHAFSEDLGASADDERAALMEASKIFRSYLVSGGAPEELHEATGFNIDTQLFPWEEEPYEDTLARRAAEKVAEAERRKSRRTRYPK